MKKIFLIDREVNILYGLEARLSASGARVVVDSYFDEPLLIRRRIKEASVDYIVMGLDFSDEKNIEFLHDVKADDQLSLIPLFVFVHSDSHNALAICDKLGVEYCVLAHDFNMDTFAARIIRIINNKYSVNK